MTTTWTPPPTPPPMTTRSLHPTLLICHDHRLCLCFLLPNFFFHWSQFVLLVVLSLFYFNTMIPSLGLSAVNFGWSGCCCCGSVLILSGSSAVFSARICYPHLDCRQFILAEAVVVVAGPSWFLIFSGSSAWKPPLSSFWRKGLKNPPTWVSLGVEKYFCIGFGAHSEKNSAGWVWAL